MAKNKTSLTFTERAARRVQSPLMAFALMGTALTGGVMLSNDVSLVNEREAPALNATPQQLQTIHQIMAAEGARLHTTGTRLQAETSAVRAALESGSKSESQIIELRVRYDDMHRQSQQKDVALAAYHARLLGSPYISEQSAWELYSKNLKGTSFDGFYTQDMAYRDECRLSLNYGTIDISGDSAGDIAKRRQLKSCMAENVSQSEVKVDRLVLLSGATGAASYLGLGLLFGAAAGASRRRANKKVADNYVAGLKKIEDLIKPKTP